MNPSSAILWITRWFVEAPTKRHGAKGGWLCLNLAHAKNDFGDSWQHEVKVEKILPYDPDDPERFDLEAVNVRLQPRRAKVRVPAPTP